MPGINFVLEAVSDPAGGLQTLLSTHTLLSAACQLASDYLAVDEELETGELPTQEDIIALVEGDDQTDDTADDQDNLIPPPSHKQAIEAVRILQSFFDSKED